MKIAMIQNNYTVADFENNIEKILNSCKANSQADLIVFSELTLSGYYPWDLVYRPSFKIRQETALQQIIEYSKETNAHIALGLVGDNTVGFGKQFKNSMVVIHQGKIVFDYDKKLLPTYNIFDEKRHFEEGSKSGIAKLNIAGEEKTIGFLICEDGWNDETYDYVTNPIKELVSNGASILISLNASPYNIQKSIQRDVMFGKIATRYGIPFVYVNQVGANDDILFDGASFAFNAKGQKVVQMKFFEEDSLIYDTQSHNVSLVNIPSRYEEIFKAISLGLKDFMHKQGMSKVITGASGGVDSSLTLTIAALALGKENVSAITMPSKYSSSGSVNDSVELCKNLGIKIDILPIENIVSSFNDGFKKEMDMTLTGVAAENIQARVRGMALMGTSNQNGTIVLLCSNKTESSLGFFTIFGDSASGFGLIGDLYKTEVYELCNWINQEFGNLIPEAVLTKKASAELSPGATDEQHFGVLYENIDAILKKELEWEFFTQEEQIDIQKLIEEVSEEKSQRIISLIDKAEFKRKLLPTVLRLHPRAFGNGRKIPIVHK